MPEFTNMLLWRPVFRKCLAGGGDYLYMGSNPRPCRVSNARVGADFTIKLCFLFWSILLGVCFSQFLGNETDMFQLISGLPSYLLGDYSRRHHPTLIIYPSLRSHHLFFY